jgi:hypothetical protein
VSRRIHDRHDEVAELLGAYALNAVDDDERTLVDDHLAECPKCRAEVADHILVATTLGNRGGDAPDGLWDRIIGELEQSAPPMRLDLAAGEPARVIPLAERRAARTRLVATIGSIAAAAVLIAGLGTQVIRQGDRIDELQAAMQIDVVQEAANVALADPDGQRVQLASADGTRVATAVLLPDGSGYLLRGELPSLDEERTYQLWGQTSGGLVSLGILGARPNDVVAFSASGPVAALAITEETAGGVRQSQNAPVVSGRFD